MESFAKIVKSYNYFPKVLYLTSLKGFWVRLFLNKYSLTVAWTRTMYCMRHFRNPDIFRTLSFIIISEISRHIHVLFRYIQPYFDIFRTKCNSWILRTQDIFRTLSRYILVNSDHCLTLIYRELCHNQKFAMFRSLEYLWLEAYSEPCQISEMESVRKLVKGIIILSKRSIFAVWEGSEQSSVSISAKYLVQWLYAI